MGIHPHSSKVDSIAKKTMAITHTHISKDHDFSRSSNETIILFWLQVSCDQCKVVNLHLLTPRHFKSID